MLEGVEGTDSCTGSNWYLYVNKEVNDDQVDGSEVEETRELKDFESAFSRKGRTFQESISAAMLRMLSFSKQESKV